MILDACKQGYVAQIWKCDLRLTQPLRAASQHNTLFVKASQYLCSRVKQYDMLTGEADTKDHRAVASSVLPTKTKPSRGLEGERQKLA